MRPNTATGGAPGSSRPPAPSAPRLHAATQRLGGVAALDAVATRLGRAVRNAVPPGPLRDGLGGRALGHALHPLMTDLPIGTWTSANLLDAIGGRDADRAARRLIAVGIAAALPAAATGLLDWADTEPVDDEVRRVGIVHAASNVAALSLYSASLVARRRGAPRRGRLLGLAGAGALLFGGHLGGHLSLPRRWASTRRRSVRASRTGRTPAGRRPAGGAAASRRWRASTCCWSASTARSSRSPTDAPIAADLCTRAPSTTGASPVRCTAVASAWQMARSSGVRRPTRSPRSRYAKAAAGSS